MVKHQLQVCQKSGFKVYLHICEEWSWQFLEILLSLVGKLSLACRAHPYVSDPAEKLSKAISSYLTI